MERRYQSVRFANIVLNYDNVPFDKKILEDSLPRQLKEKLLLNAKRALQRRNDALKYLHTLNKSVQSFQQEELRYKMAEFVHVEPPGTDIGSIRCTVSYQLSLPDFFHVKISCSVDAEEQAIKGKVIFDREELISFISQILVRFDKASEEGSTNG
jgi:hypothetical protein